MTFVYVTLINSLWSDSGRQVSSMLGRAQNSLLHYVWLWDIHELTKHKYRSLHANRLCKLNVQNILGPIVLY
jgi:hypothetical protein